MPPHGRIPPTRSGWRSRRVQGTWGYAARAYVWVYGGADGEHDGVGEEVGRRWD